ncbi:lipoprotein [Streptomyces xiamenensis]|uniref:Lipoprotein n=2 Tax=Streptomyces xiamenensis TaxID=408015 RepID=A0A0F7FWG6_9ACTN|nr:lipoprotein [Streptomyces xiamenensis]
MKPVRWHAALAASMTGMLLTGCAQTTLFKEQARESRPDDSTVVLSETAAERDGEPETPQEIPLLDRSAEEIFFAGMETAFAAESLRAVMVIDDQDGLYEMDMHYDLSGRCVATFSEHGHGGMEFIVTGDEAWVRPDSEFVESLIASEPEWADLIRQQIEGRYRHVTPGEPGADELLTMCRSDEFLDLMDVINDAGADGGYGRWAEKGEPTTHEGAEVIPIDGNDGESWISALVATEGEPYMRHLLVDSGPEGVMELWMSDFGVPVEIEAPSPELVYGPDDLLFDFFGELYV